MLTTDANLNDDFYQSIPKPLREIVKLQTGDVAASHELTRAASMALVLVYRARSQPDGGADAQAALLKQSDLYFNQAVAHLETASIPLEAQLIAMADMQVRQPTRNNHNNVTDQAIQLHQFDQAGAAAAYAILLVGELFVNQALGPRPSLDLVAIADPSGGHIGMFMFVFADVLRSICLPRQRTIFNFVGLPGEGDEVSEEPALSAAYNTHLGLPTGLLLCFAAASNLSADLAEGLELQIVKKKAAAIEEAIRAWKSSPPDSGLDSITFVDTVATQEMWRQVSRLFLPVLDRLLKLAVSSQAALIYLYQSVYHVGALSVVVRQALQQILQLGARKISPPKVEDVNSMYAGSVRACPWFLAATVALSESDRDLCRQGLSVCGPQKAYQDNLKAVERIWEMTDVAGWPVDWKEVAERESLFIAFL
jgi:hypothetical protein